MTRQIDRADRRRSDAVRATNSATEEKGGFFHVHNVAHAIAYRWLCGETDEAQPDDTLGILCAVAEPAEPSGEPKFAVGEETSVTFPVTITPSSWG